MRIYPSWLISPWLVLHLAAAPINFTFKAVTAEVSFNGAPAAKIDLTVDLPADTANLIAGGGWFGSDRYLNLKAFVSSKALGLSNVEAATPLEIHIAGPASESIFRSSTVLLVSEGVVNGVFGLRAIGGWNKVSSIGPLLGPATASGPLKIALKNGDTVSINTLESAQPYGNASFQAHLAPEIRTPPVTGSLRKMGEKNLYLETEGNKVMRFRLLAKTQFRDPQGAAIRDSLLHSGDRLSVVVNPDDPETAISVVLVHKRDRRGT